MPTLPIELPPVEWTLSYERLRCRSGGDPWKHTGDSSRGSSRPRQSGWLIAERRPLAQVARELDPDYRAPAEYEQAACISRAT